MNCLIDTCVIIDAMLERENFVDYAQRIFVDCAEELFRAYITSKQLADIHYLLKHGLHDETKTREALRNLLIIFDILPVGKRECVDALNSSLKDFEDAMLLETAINHHMDCIVTRNQKDFKKASFRILSPKEFLEVLHNKDGILFIHDEFSFYR